MSSKPKGFNWQGAFDIFFLVVLGVVPISLIFGTNYSMEAKMTIIATAFALLAAWAILKVRKVKSLLAKGDRALNGARDKVDDFGKGRDKSK